MIMSGLYVQPRDISLQTIYKKNQLLNPSVGREPFHAGAGRERRRAAWSTGVEAGGSGGGHKARESPTLAFAV